MNTELEDNRKGQSSSNSNLGNSETRSVVSLAAAQAYCRRLARGHYENFLIATLFLPRSLKQDFYNVYAYCRTADDLADLSESPQVALEKLRSWRQSLQQMFAGSAEHPVLVALADTAHRHRLTIQPFARLLDAFEADQVKTRYANFGELLQYCEGSANPVGQIILRLAGQEITELGNAPAMLLTDAPADIATLSNRICTGLQLANHWQDIARDYQIGRVYLPQDEMRRYEVTDQQLAAPRAGHNLRQLLEFQCDRAQSLLVGGLPLVDRVPRWLATDVQMFVQGGLATLAAIRRRNYDVLQSRPKVSRWTQARLLTAAYLHRWIACV